MNVEPYGIKGVIVCLTNQFFSKQTIKDEMSINAPAFCLLSVACIERVIDYGYYAYEEIQKQREV